MNILARDPEIQARIQTNVPARVPFKIQSKRIFYGCVTFFAIPKFSFDIFLKYNPKSGTPKFQINIHHEIQYNRKGT